MIALLIVSRATMLKIVTHCFHEMPYEGCGILVEGPGRVEARPCKNDDPSTSSFQICVHDQERIVNEGLPILGTYHSHPRGIASLSADDVDMLPVDMIHVVVGMKEKLEVRAWSLRATGSGSKVIRRIPLQINQ